MLAVYFAQTENVETRLLVLVFGLVFVAFGLTVITVWYWKFTDPKKVPTKAAISKQNKFRNPVAKAKNLNRINETINVEPHLDLDKENYGNAGLDKVYSKNIRRGSSKDPSTPS